MLQHETGQALLAAALAVKQELIAPNKAAAVLAESVMVRGRDWFQMLLEWQLANAASVEALKAQFNAELVRHDGDVEQALRQTVVDARLRQEIERFRLPVLMELLEISPLDGTSVEETSMPDRYDTLPSHTPSELGSNDDPYTTGRIPSSLPADTSMDSVPAGGTGSSAPTDAAPSSGSNVIQTPAPPGRTHPDQRVIKSESILEVEQPADYATQAPVTPNFATLDQSTIPPKGDYATLRSELPGRVETHGRHAPDEADATVFIPRFRVLREHAKGGLGKVSVAEDLELHREVAFKEIQRRYSSDQEARARFLLEAEITGGLEHPGIVPVYGLGTHPDGRPYYAMRFIRGRTLQQGIEHYYKSVRQGADPGTLQLEFRQLLRRFTDVCNAIEYAHNRGIIHRDIKPGNIMLGDYGETLVVDWGIAKSVSIPGSLFKASLMPLQPKMAGDASQTVMGVAIGTPQFMSPEQAKGNLDELGPTSDVYSLGATLYCLLTGVAAFTSREVETVIKQVKVGSFPAPQTVNPKIPKPLNAICLKAMALQPALRYQSARQLSEDIEHWLADEPVAAYQEDRWERARRWVRHNQARAQAIAVSVIVIAIVSSAAAFLIDQSRRAEANALRKETEAHQKEIAAKQSEAKAKQEALRRSRDAREAIDTLLVGISDGLGELADLPGMQDIRRSLLEQGVKEYTKLAQERSTDPGLQLEASRSMLKLGEVYLMLNLVEEARRSFDFVAATAMYTADVQAGSNLKQLQGRARFQLGMLELQAKNLPKAVTYLNDAVAIMRTLVTEHPGRSDFKIDLGDCQIGLGKAFQAENKALAADSELQQGLLLFQTLRREHPKDVNVLSAAAKAEAAYARYLIDSARPVDAVRMFEQAIEIHNGLIEEFPNNPEYLGQRATATMSLSEALRSLGDWNRAVRNDQSTVADLEEVVRARPDVPRHRENLAAARYNLGTMLRRQGRNVEAVPVLHKALQERQDLAESYVISKFVEGLANVRTVLAQVQSEMGQHDPALENIDLAVTDYQQLLAVKADFPAFLEGTGVVYQQRGRILARRGDLTRGVQSLEESIKLLEQSLASEPGVGRVINHVAWSWWGLGQIQYTAGKVDEARAAFQKSIEIRQKLILSHKDSPGYRDSLAWQLITCPVEELRDLKQALLITKSTSTSFTTSTQFWLTRGAALLINGDATEALAALEKSATLRGVEDGLTLCFTVLAEAKLKRTQEAQNHLAKAKAWQQAQRSADEELAYWIKQAEAAVGAPAEGKK